VRLNIENWPSLAHILTLSSIRPAESWSGQAERTSSRLLQAAPGSQVGMISHFAADTACPVHSCKRNPFSEKVLDDRIHRGFSSVRTWLCQEFRFSICILAVPES
jgi:hypothetical protein